MTTRTRTNRPIAPTGPIAALTDHKLHLVSLGLCASLLAVAGVIVLRSMEEPFAAASDIGGVILDLGIAYAAGWIFYYLTVWRPHAVNWLAAGPLVSRAALRLAGTAELFLGHLRHTAGQEHRTEFKRAELLDLVRNLSPASPTNMMNSLSGQGLTLGDAAHYSRLRIDSAVAEIERWSSLVDPELLRLAYHVADCPFVRDDTISTEPSLYGGRAEMLLKWLEASDRLKMWVAANLERELRAIGYDAAAISKSCVLID
jgi:hypothetical protein